MKLALHNRLKSVRILGVDYEVLYFDKQEDVNFAKDALLRGQVCLHTDTIRIYGGMCEVEQKRSILHEVIHVVALELGLDMKEDAVACLETGLWCAVVDNPVLFERKGMKNG